MKRRIKYILVLAVSVVCTSCYQQEGRREQMVNLQEVADKPEVQLTNLNNAIARSKRDGSLYARRAVVLLRQGKAEQALEDANEAVKLSKNDPANLFVKAQVLRVLGREEDALRLALRAERNSFQSPSLYVLLGDLYLQKRAYAKAESYIDKALEASPVDEYALYYKGRVQTATGDTTKAIRSFRASLEQAPDFFEPHRELTGLLVGRKDFDAARVYLKQAQQLSPEDGKLWYYTGLIYQEEQKPDSAFQSFRKALAVADTLYNAHYQVGLQLHSRGDNEAAITHLEKAAKEYGHRPRHMAALASSYERTGQYKKALEQYQRLVAAEPTYTYVYQSISRIKSKLARPIPDSTTVYSRKL